MQKTNLSKAYKTDSKKETDGVWIDIDEGVQFLVKRYGGENQAEVKKLQIKYVKPYARQIEKNLLPVDVEKAIYVKIFVKAAMRGWKGVTDENGTEIEFSESNAIGLFKQLPDLFDTVVEVATDIELYREDLGNS